MAQKILTILSIDLGKLVNHSFAYFMEMILRFIDAIGFANLGIKEEVYLQFKSTIERLNHLVNSTHGSSITKVLHELDKKRTDGFSCFNGIVKYSQKHLVPEISQAAEELHLILIPFKDMAKLAHDDRSQSLISFYEQMKTPEIYVKLVILGLMDLLEKINSVNIEYIENEEKRLIENESTACMPTRLECEDQCRDIFIIAQSSVVMNPTAEGTAFIESVNKLIVNTNTTYNQKKSHHKPEPIIEEGNVEEGAVELDA